MPLVEVPGKGTVEFPDNMDNESIAQAIQANFPGLAPTRTASAPLRHEPFGGNEEPNIELASISDLTSIPTTWLAKKIFSHPEAPLQGQPAKEVDVHQSVVGISPEGIPSGFDIEPKNTTEALLFNALGGKLGFGVLSAAAKTGAGLGQFLTSPQGLTEMGIAATPAAPAMLAKWLLDMAEGAATAPEKAIERYKAGDYQGTIDELTGGVAALAGVVGAGKGLAHKIAPKPAPMAKPPIIPLTAEAVKNLEAEIQGNRFKPETREAGAAVETPGDATRQSVEAVAPAPEVISRTEPSPEVASAGTAPEVTPTRSPVTPARTISEPSTPQGGVEKSGADILPEPATNKNAPENVPAPVSGGTVPEPAKVGGKKGAPGSDVQKGQSAQPEAPANVANPPRVVKGLRARKIFQKETELGGPDILSWIAERGGMMSKSSARKFYGQDKFKTNKAEWDGAPPLSKPHHNVIYSTKTRETPDRIATAAWEEGLIKSPDVNALWTAIEGASNKRSNVFATARREQAFMEKEAAEYESWTKATEKGEVRVAADEMKVGDVMDIEGERAEVIAIDADTGTVTLKDGTKFGRQTLESGKNIYVEKFEPTEKGGFDAEPFGLEKPETIAEQRVRIEQESQSKAQRESELSAAEIARQKQQQRLGGDLGSAGQGKLFQEPGQQEIFAPPSPGKTAPVEKGAEAESSGVAGRVNEVVDSAKQQLGITPQPFTAAEIAQDLPLSLRDLQSLDPKVEARWQAAKIATKTISEKVKTAALETKHAFTRHFPKLDRNTDGAEIDILRQHEAVPQWSQMKAGETIRGIVAGLGPRKYGVFERLVILPDLIKDIDRGLYDGKKELPFGYADRAAMEADLTRFQALAKRFSDIGKAVDVRRKFINTLRDELVARDLLPEHVKDFDEYYHHQVLEHMAMRDSVTPGTSAGDVREHTQGWQKGRVGSAKDFNTRYIESEFEVLSQAFAQMATQDTLKRIKATSDISDALKQAAEVKEVEDWRTLLPKDYALWQPERGNHFYWANTLGDKALESYLQGLKVLTEADFKKALALGAVKEQWAIPKRLAETLDEFQPRRDTVVEKFVGAGISGWKVWTLLNPFRVVKYNINNLSGDVDIVMAYKPEILKGTPKAAADLRQWILKKKAATPELDMLVKKGVLSSSFSVAEVPDISKHRFFKVLTGENEGLISRWWETTKDYTRWREEVLRLAAYRHFKAELGKGKELYGASKPEEVRAVKDLDDRAAKLARELIGDYGNRSVAGQWLRSHMIPFYSWMEINAPRYARLFRNLRHEGEGTGRAAGVVSWKMGRKAATLSVKAAALYLMVNLWNKSFFAKEEDELGAERNQLHLILGRNEDGTIRSLRIQGALSDALSWFGAEDLPSDVADVATGKESIGEKLVESAKAPVNKIVNASSPIQKTVMESMAGVSLYPDVFNPRPIRDRTAHIAKLVSMGTVYKYLADRPRPGLDKDLIGLVTYTTDAGEASYHVARGLVADWMKKNNMERELSIPTERQNALYYYKQAIKYKDKRLEEKYWKKYEALGGTDKGAATSIERSSPTGAIPKKQLDAFFESLSPREQQILERAEEWYDKTYNE